MTIYKVDWSFGCSSMAAMVVMGAKPSHVESFKLFPDNDSAQVFAAKLREAAKTLEALDHLTCEVSQHDLEPA